MPAICGSERGRSSAVAVRCAGGYKIDTERAPLIGRAASESPPDAPRRGGPPIANAWAEACPRRTATEWRGARQVGGTLNRGSCGASTACEFAVERALDVGNWGNSQVDFHDGVDDSRPGNDLACPCSRGDWGSKNVEQVRIECSRAAHPAAVMLGVTTYGDRRRRLMALATRVVWMVLLISVLAVAGEIAHAWNDHSRKGCSLRDIESPDFNCCRAGGCC